MLPGQNFQNQTRNHTADHAHKNPRPYLVGGLCVKADCYRRLPQSHFADCKVQGGVAQIMLDTAAKVLADGMALVGYCGDARARKVGLRAGYIPTRYPFLIIKALARLDQRVFDATLDDVARIGAF